MLSANAHTQVTSHTHALLDAEISSQKHTQAEETVGGLMECVDGIIELTHHCPTASKTLSACVVIWVLIWVCEIISYNVVGELLQCQGTPISFKGRM